MLRDNIIRIEGEAAHEFLEAAWRPDPEALRRRDEMFRQWEAERVSRQEGADIALEIPDIDFEPESLELPAVSRTELYFPVEKPDSSYILVPYCQETDCCGYPGESALMFAA